MRGSSSSLRKIPSLHHFNSRLYMRGSAALAAIRNAYSIISIHASTWEAAACLWVSSRNRNISIHASTWEAAQIPRASWPSCIFQFTPLHERQPTAAVIAAAAIPFQFTPLHERQQLERRRKASETHFNSRLYMRGSISCCIDTVYSTIFQFTPLHERQLMSPLLLQIIKNFNLRLYMRGSNTFPCHSP